LGSARFVTNNEELIALLNKQMSIRQERKERHENEQLNFDSIACMLSVKTQQVKQAIREEKYARDEESLKQKGQGLDKKYASRENTLSFNLLTDVVHPAVDYTLATVDHGDRTGDYKNIDSLISEGNCIQEGEKYSSPSWIENLISTMTPHGMQLLNGKKGIPLGPVTPPKYGFSYLDNVGLNKTYLPGNTRPVKASDTPFESEIITHLIGNKNPNKTTVMETTSAVKVPMKGDDGNIYEVRSDFIHYRGANGQVTIMPNGKVDTSDEQHMKRNMLPGMTREKGEFSVYSIPPENIHQHVPGTFCSFSLSDNSKKNESS